MLIYTRSPPQKQAELAATADDTGPERTERALISKRPADEASNIDDSRQMRTPVHAMNCLDARARGERLRYRAPDLAVVVHSTRTSPPGERATATSPLSLRSDDTHRL